MHVIYIWDLWVPVLGVLTKFW
jgi:hypothetical protein